MTETWDLSLQIDASTRIHDARGMAAEILGIELRQLIGGMFIDFVDPSNRAAFRRRLVKMAAGTLKIVKVRVMTRAEEPQQFSAALKSANTDGQWWLMLATANHVAPETPVADDEPETLAQGDEFMMLVEGAARQLDGAVDLMQVRAGLLTDEGAASGTTTQNVREQLASEFDTIVADNAYERIATKPQPGEYLMLRERAKPAEEVLGQLGAAAERLSVSSTELGLESKSVGLETLGGDFSQANINGVVYDLRRDPNKPPAEWELGPQPHSWIKPVIRAASAALSGVRSYAERNAKKDR